MSWSEEFDFLFEDLKRRCRAIIEKILFIEIETTQITQDDSIF